MLNPDLHPRRQRGGPRAALLVLAVPLIAACSPALNWREIRPKGLDILLSFPCKPQQITQDVRLAGNTVKMSMTGCTADDMTFALAHADVKDASRVGAALAVLHQAAVRNVGGTVTRSRASAVDHAASGLPDALDLEISGKSPTGKPLRERVVLFAQGSQVYQATAFGHAKDYKPEAAQTFSGSVRLSGHGAGD